MLYGPDGVVVILWDCGSQEPGSNPGPGPSNSSFSPYHDFQLGVYTYKLFSFQLVHVRFGWEGCSGEQEQ